MTHRIPTTSDPSLVHYTSEQRIGIYKTPDAARRAKAIMIERGIPPSQVSVLAAENPDGRDRGGPSRGVSHCVPAGRRLALR